MQSELKACRCGRTPRLTKRDVEPQGDIWYQGRMALFVICDCGICLFDEYFHEGFSSESEAIAAWNTRAEGDARDAARYRWLRRQHESDEALSFCVFGPDGGALMPIGSMPEELDAAIDAALKTSTGEGN